MQIRPEEWRIIKDIWDAVIFSADIIRSPSFSRWGLSRTIMNSLFPFIGGKLVHWAGGRGERRGGEEGGRERYEKLQLCRVWSRIGGLLRMCGCGWCRR